MDNTRRAGAHGRALVACAVATTTASTAGAQWSWAEPAREPEDLRLRFGLAVGATIAGGGAPEDSAEVSNVWPAAGGVLDLELGVQLHDVFAVYYQAGLIAASSFEACIDVVLSTSCKGGRGGMLLHTSSAVMELTLVDGLQLGFGPSLVAGSLGLGLDRGTVRAGGLFRIGWAFGGRSVGTSDGGARRGPFIGAELKFSGRGPIRQASGVDAWGDPVGPFQKRGEPLVALSLLVGWASF